MNNQESLLANLAPLNKIALSFFVLAKFMGFCGISLGFLGSTYHQAGGVILIMAIFFIFCSIVCALVQSANDKKIFQKEDERKCCVETLARRKRALESEIRKLEEQRNIILSHHKKGPLHTGRYKSSCEI